ncbi:hypothetical protein C6361_07200 [Plantactinospora sp. BC1]|uniref:hypothetical protein n=1 Tax=Plantactinospora sp. BC1 TaxID=2108470 RepID=UPI000D155A03|nr:hypothetical protein [Plantactinospora sp. BC1]AVT29311.1 hypothetical protein C6361_07200 [Plantactinospora sp. BC1]
MCGWRRWCGSLLVVPVLLVGMAGCGLDPGDDGGAPAGGTAASEAGRTYGYGPSRDRSIRYQPDVVLVEGGPEAIRSASADGTTWVLDAGAPGADDLEPGRIMYATSRAVGRVVQARRSGDELAVTLAPVTLTEVFRNAHFRTERRFDEADLAYQEVPNLPGAVSVPAGTRSPETADTPIGLDGGGGAPGLTVPALAAAPRDDDGSTVVAMRPIRLAPAGGGRLPPARERNFAVSVGDWEAQPYRTPGKLGLKIGYAANENLKVYIDFAMNVADLRIRADVPISNGRIGSSTFAVDGIRSISVDVSAGAANGADDNRKVRVEVPVEINIPIAGEPLVYSNTWKFIVTTGLSGRNTTVTAAGEWAVNGTLGVIGGTLQKPTLSVVRSIMDSITGISIGPSGLAFAVETKIQFGIGIPAAFAGPYAKLVVDLGVTNGSALGAPLARCVSASLNAKVGGGFGITASSVAVEALQKLLPTKLKFELESEKLWPIHRAAQTLPNVPLCVG